MMELLDLNNDCLMHVLERLRIETIVIVSETCERLGCLAKVVFKRHKYYDCIIGNDREKNNETFNIIRNVGQHFIKIDIKFTMKGSLYFQNEDGFTVLTLLKQSVGEKLLELSINSEICSVPVLRLFPTFVHLEKLMIHKRCNADISNDVFCIDLPALCLNLKVLIIEGCPIIFAPNPKKSFHRLQEFEFQAFGRYYPIDIIDMFASFMKQNKQLKKLYVDTLWDEQLTSDVYIDLRDLAKNLPNLEELRLQTIVFDNLVQGIRDMKGLTNLHTLEMADYWEDVEKVNGILKSLNGLKHLKRLWIGSSVSGIPDQQSIISIAVALKLLQSFKCNLELENSTITEFIGHRPNLNTICMKLRDNTELTPNLIRHFAEKRKSAAGIKHQPLTIDFYNKGYTLDLIQVFEEPKVGRFLQLSRSPSFDRSKYLWSGF